MAGLKNLEESMRFWQCSDMPKASHLRPRPVRIVGDVAYVTLTLGYSSIIDAEDAERVGAYNWAVTVQPGGARATRKFRGHMTPLHRFIMRAAPGVVVDHINGDTLDNRKANLRICTHKQNMWNRRRRKDRALPTGIHLTKAGTYLVKLTHEGRRIYIGCYKTLDAAKEARRKADLKYRGEFSPYASAA